MEKNLLGNLYHFCCKLPLDFGFDIQEWSSDKQVKIFATVRHIRGEVRHREMHVECDVDIIVKISEWIDGRTLNEGADVRRSRKRNLVFTRQEMLEKHYIHTFDISPVSDYFTSTHGLLEIENIVGAVDDSHLEFKQSGRRLNWQGDIHVVASLHGKMHKEETVLHVREEEAVEEQIINEDHECEDRVVDNHMENVEESEENREVESAIVECQESVKKKVFTGMEGYLVSNPSGKPLAKRKLIITLNDKNYNLNTDENGYFRAANIAPGTYEVKFRKLSGHRVRVIRNVPVHRGKLTDLKWVFICREKAEN